MLDILIWHIIIEGVKELKCVFSRCRPAAANQSMQVHLTVQSGCIRSRASAVSTKGLFLLSSEVLTVSVVCVTSNRRGKIKAVYRCDCCIQRAAWIYCLTCLFSTFPLYLPDVPSNGLYFLTYEYLKNLLTPEGQRWVTMENLYRAQVQRSFTLISRASLCVYVCQCVSDQHSQHPPGWWCGRDIKLDNRSSSRRPQIQLSDRLEPEKPGSHVMHWKKKLSTLTLWDQFLQNLSKVDH